MLDAQADEGRIEPLERNGDFAQRDVVVAVGVGENRVAQLLGRTGFLDRGPEFIEAAKFARLGLLTEDGEKLAKGVRARLASREKTALAVGEHLYEAQYAAVETPEGIDDIADQLGAPAISRGFQRRDRG